MMLYHSKLSAKKFILTKTKSVKNEVNILGFIHIHTFFSKSVLCLDDNKNVDVISQRTLKKKFKVLGPKLLNYFFSKVRAE